MNLWNRSKSIIGTKNDKQTAAGAQFSEALLRRLMPLGAVTVKKMFGGFGIFQKGKMFGLVSSDAEFFLKVDESNQARFRRARAPQHGKMPYFRVPKSVLGNDSKLLDWASSAAEVAHA